MTSPLPPPPAPLDPTKARRPLRALFVHQGFPGQFEHLAPALAGRAGVQVWSIGATDGPRLPGVRHLVYGTPGETPSTTHRYLQRLDAEVRRGQTLANRLIGARDKEGLKPDIVICHPGGGEGLFLRDIFPHTRILQYCERFVRAHGQDTGFQPNERVGADDAARLRMANAAQLLSFEAADWGLAPTAWQRDTYPAWARARISPIHEGIDTARCAPRDDARFRTADGHQFRRGDEVISYAARNLEPHRGIQSFLGALAMLQAARPGLHAVIAGGDDVSHGPKPPGGGSWREALLAQMAGQLDLARIHFTGTLEQDQLHALFRVTAAHVHLTYPFPLSWSVLEAMACGAVVVGSDTPPVAEVITHGENGLLAPFWNPPAIAVAVGAVLDDRAGHAHLGAAARQTVVDRYDLYGVCLPRQLDLIERVAAGLTPDADP